MNQLESESSPDGGRARTSQVDGSCIPIRNREGGRCSKMEPMTGRVMAIRRAFVFNLMIKYDCLLAKYDSPVFSLVVKYDFL